MMKNITMSIDEKVLAVVCRHAAEQNSNTDGLAREDLMRLAGHEDRADHARERLRVLSAESQGRLGEKTWKRDDLHDR